LKKVATSSRERARATGKTFPEKKLTPLFLFSLLTLFAQEAQDGHDGTWVAHPALVPVARAVFDAQMPSANQISSKPRLDVNVTERDLLTVPEGPRTEATLRHNCVVGVLYLEAWLRGLGCVPLFALMEDAATAEICRTQVWQWIRHSAVLESGEGDGGRGGFGALTAARFDSILDQEMEKVRAEKGDEAWRGGKFDEAVELFRRFSTSRELVDFLTIEAYQRLVVEEQGSGGRSRM
jgi:malate synthase